MHYDRIANTLMANLYRAIDAYQRRLAETRFPDPDSLDPQSLHPIQRRALEAAIDHIREQIEPLDEHLKHTLTQLSASRNS